MTQLTFDSSFCDSTKRQRYRLLELDDAERIGTTSLTLKSNGTGDGAVLCSDTATFVLKKVETSNALLLIDTARDSSRVLAQLDAFYECVKSQPSMQRLAQLLADAGSDGISLSQIRRRVPASDAEIDVALRQLRALPVAPLGSGGSNADPRFFVLSPSEAARLLQMAIAEVQLHDDMSIDRIDLRRLVDAVALLEPNRHTVHALLQHYVVDGAMMVDAVALVFARALLERRTVWRESEFMAEWRALLPPTVAQLPPLEQLLLGIALIDNSGDAFDDALLTLFDRDSLSLDANTRLTQMFAKRAQWPVAHVEPYLAPLLAPAQLAKLLQRSTRTVTIDDRKYFVHRE
jgi:hypothetical protein